MICRGKMRGWVKRLLQLMVSLACVVALAQGTVWGQSCAMCYTTAAAGGKAYATTLRDAIVVLLVPPVAIFCGLTWLVMRWQSLRTSVSGVLHRDTRFE